MERIRHVPEGLGVTAASRLKDLECWHVSSLSSILRSLSAYGTLSTDASFENTLKSDAAGATGSK